MSNVTEYNLSNLPTADVVKVWSKDDVKEFLQRNRTDLELEENDVNVIYDQNVTGKAFLRLKEEQLTRDPGPFKLLFGPASAIAEVVKQISGEQPVSDISDLKSSIEHIKDKLGDIYELTARHEISKTQGSHYTSKFDVFDAYGLIRLALPRKQLAFEHADYNSQLYILLSRANKLTNYIYAKGMRKKLQESIEYINNLPPEKSYSNKLKELAKKANQALKDWTKYEGKP